MNASTLAEIYRKAKVQVTQEELDRQVMNMSCEWNQWADLLSFIDCHGKF
jgi:calmodulin/centrin-1